MKCIWSCMKMMMVKLTAGDHAAGDAQKAIVESKNRRRLILQFNMMPLTHLVLHRVVHLRKIDCYMCLYAMLTYYH